MTSTQPPTTIINKATTTTTTKPLPAQQRSTTNTNNNQLYPLPPLLYSIGITLPLFPWWYWYLSRFYEECRYASDLFWQEQGTGGKQTGLYENTYISKWFLPNPRPMDLKDPQWSAFRDGLGILTFVLCMMILTRQVLFPKQKTNIGLLISLGLIIYLHRAGTILSLGFCLMNYVLTVKIHPLLGFCWCMGTLILIKIQGGLENELPLYLPHPIHEWWIQLNTILGTRILPWHACYPLMMLRMSSFAMDNYNNSTNNKINFKLYVFYIYYAPLYITGPIIRSMDFVGYENNEKPKPSFRAMIIPYSIRFIIDLLFFEWFSSYFYVTALTRMLVQNPHQLTPKLYELTHENYSVMSHVSFCALIGVWFKFLLVWRYARLIALCDGIDPPENMKRCIANNYSVRGFWRDWHCSFNSWLVRYLYIPLGGSKNGIGRQFFAIIISFGFVALWHDIELRMAAWAGALSILILPEIICARWSSTSSWALSIQKHYPYRWMFMEGFCGGIAIVGLQIVNMIGYTNGLDASKALLLDSPFFKTWEGRIFALRWLLSMSAAACVMQKIRTWEKHSSSSSSSNNDDE
jgi:D-alanyl-lipoteichoic acid acyltransferase DltB (MBOAT superfamily)